MPVAGLDWLAPVRSFRNFFGTYGTTQGSVRGVLNGIVPVAVVDRYRDDTEGSLYGISATAQVPGGEKAAFIVGNPDDDWELHSASWGAFWHSNPGGFRYLNMMMYSPDATYDPLQTPSPVGFFVAGLNLDFAFTLGSTAMIAGYNATLPSRFGYFPWATHTKGSTTTQTSTSFQDNSVAFDPPVRVYRDVTLGFMLIEDVSQDLDVTLSLLLRRRPRTTSGPATVSP